MNGSTQRRPTEFRLTAPIIVAWCAAFAIVVYLNTRPNTYATQEWREWKEYFTITAAAVGVFMTLVWSSFYGRMGWMTFVRFTASVLLITAASYFGPRLFGGDMRRVAFLPLGPVFVWLVGSVPFWAVRHLWGWRILHSDEADENSGHQFTIRQAFVWTAFLALIFTVAPFAFPNKALLFFVWGIGIPCAVILSFLSLLSRMRIRYLWPCVVLLAFLTAVGYSIVGIVWSGGRVAFDRMVELVIVPVWVCCSIAGFGLLLAACYLRWQGMVLRFGGRAGFAAPRRDPRMHLWLPRPRHVITAIVGAVCLLAIILLAIIALRPKPLDPDDLRRIARDPKVDDIPVLIRALKSDSISVGYNNRFDPRTLLVRIGPPAVPELTNSLAMWSRDGRQRVASVIGEIASGTKANTSALEEAIPALERMLYKDSKNAKSWGAGQTAGIALGKIGSDRAVAVLTKALGSSRKTHTPPEQRNPLLMTANNAAKGLSRRDPPAREAFPVLVEHFRSGHLGVDDVSAVEALAKIGGADAVPILLDLLRPLSVRRYSHLAHSLFLIGPGASAAIPDLMEALNSDNEVLQLAATYGLRGIGPEAKEAVPRLRELMKMYLPDADRGERVVAVYISEGVLGAFVEIEGVSAAPILQDILSDESLPWNGRELAARMVLRIGPEAHVVFSLSDCFQLLEESNEASQQQRSGWRENRPSHRHRQELAEEVLTELEADKDDIATLEAGLKSDSVKVRKHSARLLDQLGLGNEHGSNDASELGKSD